MSLPRRSGWMFSLLSSHSTSPPSAILEIKSSLLLSDRHMDQYHLGFLGRPQMELCMLFF